MCGVCMFMHRRTLDYLLQLYIMLRRPHKRVQYNAGHYLAMPILVPEYTAVGYLFMVAVWMMLFSYFLVIKNYLQSLCASYERNFLVLLQC